MLWDGVASSLLQQFVLPHLVEHSSKRGTVYIRIDGERSTVRPDDWVLKYDDGEIRIVTSTEMARYYEPWPKNKSKGHCRQCGEAVRPPTQDIFCSQACYNAHGAGVRATTDARACGWCGTPHSASEGKFCSVECGSAHRAARVAEKPEAQVVSRCWGCGEKLAAAYLKFEDRQYCSDECVHSHKLELEAAAKSRKAKPSENEAPASTREANGNCEVCGALLISDVAKFCSDACATRATEQAENGPDAQEPNRCEWCGTALEAGDFCNDTCRDEWQINNPEKSKTNKCSWCKTPCVGDYCEDGVCKEYGEKSYAEKVRAREERKAKTVRDEVNAAMAAKVEERNGTPEEPAYVALMRKALFETYKRLGVIADLGTARGKLIKVLTPEVAAAHDTDTTLWEMLLATRVQVDEITLASIRQRFAEILDVLEPVVEAEAIREDARKGDVEKRSCPTCKRNGKPTPSGLPCCRGMVASLAKECRAAGFSRWAPKA